MSQPFKLFRLQQIDSQLDQGRIRLREIEATLSNNDALNLARQHVSEAETKLASARKALHHAEENTQSQHIKIEQTEAALYGGKVRNPKELQDLQNESAALKRFLDILEERQLVALIAVEECEAHFNEMVEVLSRITAERELLVQRLSAERTSLEQETKRLEVERQAATNSIPAEDLALYEKLRQQRRGVAVAKVNGSVCSACGSALNASLLQAARSPNLLARCDSCGRILYAV
jgi:hypothetical protein